MPIEINPATLIEPLGVALAIGGNLLINHRNRKGYVLWMASNAGLLVVSAMSGLYWMALMYVAFFALAIHGWLHWGRHDQAPDPMVVKET